MGLIALGVLVAGGWIWILSTKSGRVYLKERMRQDRACETKTTRKRAYGPERLFTPFGSRYYLVHKRVPKKGYWQASDGRWYPRHQHPNYRPPPPPPPPPKKR